MGSYHFFTKEDCISFPDDLRLKIEKLGMDLGRVFESRAKLDKADFSRQYLQIIREILLLALSNPDNFSGKMIASLGEIPGIEDIELSSDCEEAVKCLMDAELKGNLHLFLQEIADKIKAVLEK
ncbi:MAG: hypothetical protein PHO02_02830 [Candidatus Nanoarchaeia archaeon]|nr:hypothetical protein [Candidatus Nanoarchaeia archaeon]